MKRKAAGIAGIILIIAVAVIAILMRTMSGSSTGIDNSPESEVHGDSRVLVAYFSWFRIVPSESYGEDFNTCADRAKDELDNGIRPELSEHIDADTMAQYDVIYLGFPVWWYDLPMPVWTFLEEYDLSGKTVIPFFSHNGSSNGANSVNRVAELAEGATVLTDRVLSLRGSNVADSETEVKDWAKECSK